MIAEFFIYLIPFKEISNYKSTRYQLKKNTPKGALCKYSHSFEERLLYCEALRAFFKPGLKSVIFILTEKNCTKIFKRIVTHIKFKRIDIDTLEKFQYSFKATTFTANRLLLF